jgi:hypothetical protein
MTDMFGRLPEPAVMTPEQRIARGLMARKLMEDDLFNEIMSTTTAQFLTQSVRGATVEDRERARSKLIALDEIRENFVEVVNDGAIAAEGVRRSS